MNVIRNIANALKSTNPKLAAELEKEAEQFEKLNPDDRAARLEEMRKKTGR